MGTAETYIGDLLAPYRPTVPLEELVERLNNLFHSVEASHYNRRHGEIFDQLPPLWNAMIRRVDAEQTQSWSILDYGCGTGFEATQILRAIPVERIERLVCFDLSPHMLVQCRENLATVCPQAEFTTDLETIRGGKKPLNMLVTNSVLHHMPRPWRTVDSLNSLLDKGVVWLQGHEPSRRFFENPECVAIWNAFMRQRRWRKFLSPNPYFARLWKWMGIDRDPAVVAACQSYRQGLFERKPPAQVVAWLVDYHVAANPQQARAGKGFNFEEMQNDLRDRWRLDWVTSYSFMGPIPEDFLPSIWKRRADQLRQKYPQDGANFCCVWRKS